ncbi:MAG: methyltransferase domain-containing protein [Rhodospirillaceae bacterium]|jgi:SAM-dependent methyltransferase|nr:methyltransferase domain-containing protein [Rhodospirillaceae bacterium]MBT6117414.1 methyltransferase domain-containing protein [Rhodospirillaceae bacterium]
MSFGLNLKRFLRGVVADEITEEEAYRRVYREEALCDGQPDVAPDGPAPASGEVECPICGNRAGRFLPFGLDNRPNVQCPTCGSVERHRILWLYLAGQTDFMTRPARVLHTAPESCMEGRFRELHGDGYVGVDRFSAGADVETDIKALPFEEGRFDIVLSSHVLEHIRNDRPAIRELGRVLRPGGWAVVMVPYDPDNPTYEDSSIDTPEGRLAAFGHPFHFRVYGNDLPARLSEAGLDAKVLATKDLFDAETRRRFRLNNNHLLHCRKAGRNRPASG